MSLPRDPSGANSSLSTGLSRDLICLSRMNFLGLGKRMMKSKMKTANVVSLDTLLKDYKDLGGKIIACVMTMGVMGICEDDLDKSGYQVFDVNDSNKMLISGIRVGKR